MADVIDDFFGGFSLTGAMDTVMLVVTVIVIAAIALLLIFLVWKWRVYKIQVIMKMQRQGKWVTGYDKMGIFRKQGVYYAKLWKRRMQVELPDFQGIIKEAGFPDVVMMVQAGAGSVYQLQFPDYPSNVKTIDHNVTRMASMQLREDTNIYSMERNFMDKFGVHIAYLVLIVAMAAAFWFLLRKEEELIRLIGEQIALNRQYINAATNVATVGA
jgi:hypothetical protein